MYTPHGTGGGMGFASVPPSNQASKHTPVKYYRQVIGYNGIGLSIFFISMFTLAQVFYGLIDLLGGVVSPDVADSLYEMLVYALTFVLGYAVLRALHDMPNRRALPMGGIDPKFGLAAVFFALGASLLGSTFTALFSEVLAGLTGSMPTMPDIDMPATALGWILFFVSTAAFPAILEEIIFRGVLLQSLRPFGDRFAVVVSSLMFALCHGNLVQGPTTFFLGMVMAGMVLYTGSMQISILIHFANNFFVCLINLFDETIPGGIPDGAYYILLGVLAVLAIACFVYIVFKHPGVFAWKKGNYPLSFWKKTLHLITSPMMFLYLLMTIFIITLYFVPA